MNDILALFMTRFQQNISLNGSRKAYQYNPYAVLLPTTNNRGIIPFQPSNLNKHQFNFLFQS